MCFDYQQLCSSLWLGNLIISVWLDKYSNLGFIESYAVFKAGRLIFTDIWKIAGVRQNNEVATSKGGLLLFFTNGDATLIEICAANGLNISNSITSLQ